MAVAFFVFGEALFGELTNYHPAIIFALYAPSIAGLIVIYRAGKLSGLKNILLKLIPQKRHLYWFPILFFMSAASVAITRIILIWLEVDLPQLDATFFELVISTLFVFIEEYGLIGGIFGWIGFMLPYMQKKLNSNIFAGLITGLVFAIWTLPAYLISSYEINTSFLLYCLQMMSFVLFHSYVFNVTKGNLSFFLFSFWMSATGGMIGLYYHEPPVQIIQIAVYTVAFVVVHVVSKAKKAHIKLQTFPECIEQGRGAS